MALSAKQRHALAVIAAAGSDGATQTLLTAHGLSIRTIAVLVKSGLLTPVREQVRTGSGLMPPRCASRMRGKTSIASISLGLGWRLLLSDHVTIPSHTS